MKAIHRQITGLLSGSGVLAASMLAIGGAVAPAAVAGVGPTPLARLASNVSFATPPTTADCISQIGIACYAPFQYQEAYNLTPLYAKGLNGTGETIVIVDSYGFSEIGQELNVFDKAFNLPPPPHFSVLQPVGPVPPFDATARPQMVGWAEETSLDV